MRMKLAEYLRRPWLWLRSLVADLWALVLKVPGATFEFDGGWDEDFTVTPVRDDAGNPYGTFSCTHFEAAQYPKDFPNGNPLHDKVGSLAVVGGQWGPFVTQYNFPKTSEFWELDVASPLLTASKPWQAVQTVEAWVADGFSADSQGHVTAALLLYVEQNGIRDWLHEVGGTVFQKVDHTKWTKLTSTFAVPKGAKVRNVVVRVRGGWAKSSLPAGKYPLYEGFIGIDHIAAA